jgi:hypothetical protein
MAGSIVRILPRADLGQRHEVVSRAAGNLSYLLTQTFFSVPHSAWYVPSPSESVYPGLSHPVEFSCVWDRAQVYLLRRFLPALYYRLFGGASS